MKKIQALILLAALALTSVLLSAHDPNKLYINQKTVSAKVGQIEVSYQYYSPPATETHLKDLKSGSFTPWFGKLNIPVELTVRSIKIPAGEYTVGAFKQSGGDYVMGLYPGKPAQGETPDASKVIKLDSEFRRGQSPCPNVSFDFNVGHGPLADRYVLVWRFGTYSLSGALT